jgi:hypothetical protein
VSIRSLLRSLEKTWIRPLARRLRLPRFGRQGGQLAALEHRVAELESLVRELTGLAYLRLDDQEIRGSGPTSAPESREAA